jgi:hypothetical protein
MAEVWKQLHLNYNWVVSMQSKFSITLNFTHLGKIEKSCIFLRTGLTMSLGLAYACPPLFFYPGINGCRSGSTHKSLPASPTPTIFPSYQTNATSTAPTPKPAVASTTFTGVGLPWNDSRVRASMPYWERLTNPDRQMIAP